MLNRKYKSGFTLAELIVALFITAIISTVVASLAYALGTVHDNAAAVSESEAQIRFASLKISELIKHSRLICGIVGSDMIIWRADENDDGRINPGELSYIVAGPGRCNIQLLDCAPSGFMASLSISMSTIQSGLAKTIITRFCNPRYTLLIADCSNVSFEAEPAPAWSRFASISFDKVENNTPRHFQITARVESWAGNLLTASGQLGSGDDD